VRLDLYTGHFSLSNGTKAWRLQGQVWLAYLPDVEVRFTGVGSDLALDPAADTLLDLALPRGRGSAKAQIRGGLWTQAHGAIQGPFRLGRDRPARSIRIHVPNFHHYERASRIRFSGPNFPTFGERLTLEHKDWLVTLDQDPDVGGPNEALREHGGYAIAHVGRIERTSGKAIERQGLKDFLSCLHCFLSFARGFWSGPLVLEGMGARRPLWTEWASRALLTDWRGVSSWFPTYNVSEVTSAFDGFCRLWGQSTWTRAVSGAVHWYIEANLNAGAIEGSLILAHTTLELLAWTYVVEDKGLYSERVFDDGKRFPSAGRIRTLLAALKIPAALPTSLTALQAWAIATSFSGAANDGPDVATRMRNGLVHPTPTRRAALAKAGSSARVEATHLTLLYVELVILALTGYEGQFINRLRWGVTPLEATRLVPWASGAAFDLD
jgi:hypothetical protein